MGEVPDGSVGLGNNVVRPRSCARGIGVVVRLLSAVLKVDEGAGEVFSVWRKLAEDCPQVVLGSAVVEAPIDPFPGIGGYIGLRLAGDKFGVGCRQGVE